MEFSIFETSDHLFYIHKYGDTRDKDIALLCNVDLKYYRDILIVIYNAIQLNKDTSYELFFKTQEDTKNAIEWIESMIVINKLAKLG